MESPQISEKIKKVRGKTDSQRIFYTLRAKYVPPKAKIRPKDKNIIAEGSFQAFCNDAQPKEMMWKNFQVILRRRNF